MGRRLLGLVELALVLHEVSLDYFDCASTLLGAHMSLALRYEPDAFQVKGEKLMGRHAAGQGFLAGLLRYGELDSLTGMVTSQSGGQGFLETVQALRPGLTAQATDTADLAALARAGTYFLPEPLSNATAWPRQWAGATAWSLCGVTHTISSAGAMDMIASWPLAPLHPWDAVICTSAAVKRSAETLLASQADYLRHRVGATRFTLPELPVIPLGADCDAMARTPDGIAAARSRLGIGADSVVVLFLGRLSWHAKANPAPMYLGLERAARGRPVVLIECGWFANDFIRDGFDQAAKALAPSVRRIVLDGRKSEARGDAWNAADVFCSFSDNIQETFGLTPVEAMAAGLPCVVSDWDGYRDTVRDGLDGILVPSLGPPPLAGVDLALAHALNSDTYDVYLSRAQLSVAIDVAAAGAALERICGDAGLRQRMGQSGLVRARETFDWKTIVAQYQTLWRELGERRSVAHKTAVPTRNAWPARMNPFELFANYATRVLSGDDVLVRPSGITEDIAVLRTNLRIAQQTGRLTASPESVLELWRLTASPQTVASLTGGTDPAARQRLRGLMTLIKFGLLTVQPKS
jgi:alpha-maltose-1-phosphate synthase